MKNLLLLLLAAGAVPFAFFASDAEAAPPEDDAQRIMVKLGHFTDDLHASFMAIKLAEGLAKRDANVTLFVNLEGVRAADARQPLDMTWGQSGPFSAHYEAFVEAGGRVLVCPHCAKAAGLAAGDLRKGAKIASEDQVMEIILAADKILDY